MYERQLETKYESTAWVQYYSAERALKTRTLQCEAKCKEYQGDIENIGRIILDLQAQITETNVAIDAADSMVVSYGQQIAAIKVQIEGHKSDIGSYNTEISKFSAEFSAADQKVQ